MRSVLIGLLFILGGGAVIYYYNQLYKMFGPIQWFEKNMGDGRTAYVLFGFVLVVLGVLIMFGFGGSDPTSIEGGFDGNIESN